MSDLTDDQRKELEMGRSKLQVTAAKDGAVKDGIISAVDVEPRSFETSEELDHAIAGDRKSALVYWQRMAHGESDAETMLFFQTIAGKVIEIEEADEFKGTRRKRRPDALMRAISLSGTTDKNREIRNMAEAVNGLSQDDADERHHPVVGAALVRLTERKFPAVLDPEKTLQNELRKPKKPKQSK